MFATLSTAAAWLVPAVSLEPTLGYVGLTLAVPVLLAVIVALACAAVFVGAAALGIATDARWSMTLASLPLVVIAAGGVATGLRRLRRHPSSPIISLAAAMDRGLTDAELGSKARRLGELLAAGVNVPQSWVIPGSEHRSLMGETAGTTTRPPRRWVRRVHARLLASGAEAFVIRSSFSGEDSADRAAPGVYTSVGWSTQDGEDALADAVAAVWGSYFSEGAVAYRGGTEEVRPCLAVLICERVPHERAGFGASCDPTTGFLDRCLVDQAEGPAPWHGFVGVFDRVVSDLSGAAGRPDAAVLDRVAVSCATAAGLFDTPCEIEWGSVGAGVWIYQARPLSPPPPDVTTLIASGPAELPAYPLTRLSRDVLFGDGAPDSLPPGLESLRYHRAAPYLDAAAVAGAMSGAAGTGWRETTGALLDLARAWLAGPRVTLPPRQPPTPPADADAALAALEQVAVRVKTLIARQARVFRLLALVAPEGHVGAARGPLHRLAESSRGDDELAERLWFWTDRDAELSSPRSPQSGVTVVGGVASTRAPSGGRLARSLLAEREQLRLGLALANHDGHVAASILDASLAERMVDGRRATMDADVFHLTLAELAGVVRGGRPLPEDLPRRREAWQEAAATAPPATIHLTPEGGELSDPLADSGPGARGFPLGGGRIEGPLRFADSTPHDAPELPAAVVIVPDASPRWAPWASRAGGVVLLRGGPLSHIALLCRERGVPAMAAATGCEGLRDAPEEQHVLLNGDRGRLELR